MRLVHSSGAEQTALPDRSLVRLLIKVRWWWAQLRVAELDIKTLAEREAVSAAWIARIVRLAFLSPDVVDATLAGTLRAGVDAAALTATDAIVGSWAKQERAMLPVVKSR